MDRITHVHIRDCRSISALDLELQPLTVLIGENGSGKSSIIEAMELLRRMAGQGFWDDFHGIHRGLYGLLRAGSQSMLLSVDIADDAGSSLRYTVRIARQGGGAVIDMEVLMQDDAVVLDRNRSSGHILQDGKLVEVSPSALNAPRLALTSYGDNLPHPAMARLLRCLRGIEVHLAFDVGASWAGQALQRPPLARMTRLYTPADRLELMAQNLANAWASLKNDFNEAHWSETMDIVRLGLGDAVEGINVRPDPGGGQAALWLKRRALEQQLPASNLSDGTLSWLAFVALYRLHPGRSLLAMDEPELHLHPALLVRALSLLEDLSLRHPVVIATHSDRLLDLLADPASSIHVCELDAEDRTVVYRPDPEALSRGMERYGGYGRIRGEGLERRVLRRPA